ncbi:MAG: ribosomal-processing cysteine protease Prp [Agathobaculum butyriciproducens]|nr:ribosomal-processing cysteine protease Prp [Agathobaculum butyriciproducens]
MTKVTFSLQEDKILAVDILGHAGYAEEGEDIVCAAISSAAMLTTVLLEDIQKIPVDIEEDEPEARIYIGLPKDSAERGQEALQALRHYFKVLENDFSDFINVMEVQADAED